MNVRLTWLLIPPPPADEQDPLKCLTAEVAQLSGQVSTLCIQLSTTTTNTAQALMSLSLQHQQSYRVSSDLKYINASIDSLRKTVDQMSRMLQKQYRLDHFPYSIPTTTTGSTRSFEHSSSASCSDAFRSPSYRPASVVASPAGTRPPSCRDDIEDDLASYLSEDFLSEISSHYEEIQPAPTTSASVVDSSPLAVALPSQPLGDQTAPNPFVPSCPLPSLSVPGLSSNSTPRDQPPTSGLLSGGLANPLIVAAPLCTEVSMSGTGVPSAFQPSGFGLGFGQTRAHVHIDPSNSPMSGQPTGTGAFMSTERLPTASGPSTTPNHSGIYGMPTDSPLIAPGPSTTPIRSIMSGVPTECVPFAGRPSITPNQSTMSGLPTECVPFAGRPSITPTQSIMSGVPTDFHASSTAQRSRKSATPDQIIAENVDLCNPDGAGRLALILARKCYFGDKALHRGTFTGKHTGIKLDATKAEDLENKLRTDVFSNLTERMWEDTWRKCRNAIADFCKRSRQKESRK